MKQTRFPALSFVLAIVLAGALTGVLAGCSDEGSITEPQDSPPPGVTNESSSMEYMALSEPFTTNFDQTVEDGEPQPEEYGTFGKIAADIRPLRFGRIIRSMTRDVEVQILEGDSMAVAHVTLDFFGLFKIRGINGEGDTVTVEKEFHDRARKNVIFVRVNRDTLRFWRNWFPAASSLVEGATVEPEASIQIVKAELFLPNGDTVVVEEPLRFFLRHRWVGLMDRLRDGLGVHPGDDMLRPPADVPELIISQDVTLRVTVESSSDEADLVMLRFGFDAFHKRRTKMELVREAQTGENTWTRVYAKTWTVHPHRGFFHAAVEAVTHDTIFDDTAPYSVSWWGVPYKVF